MIQFDITKLRVEHVHLKACTTALGGSISIVDTDRSTDEKEVYTKISVPLAISRSFMKLHEISRYLKPVLTAVAYYEDHVVALERHPLGNAGKDETEGLFGKRKWISHIEMNIGGLLKTLTQGHDKDEWFVDGTFVYRPRPAQTGEYLSSDGRFRAVEAEAIKLANLATADDLYATDRTCLAFFASSGQSALTSPIWKNLGSVGDKQLARSASDQDLDEDDVAMATDNFQFDRVDQFLAVNLAFALKAGKEISEVFDYDAIEPLALDTLMIRLQTVNLPQVAKAVKQTYDTGLHFTHAIAWLIGLTQRTNTLDSYIVLRSLLKYLTTKGTYRKGAFDPSSVYKRGKDTDDVPFLTKESALEAIGLDWDNSLTARHISATGDRSGVGVLGGRLFGAE